VAFRSGLCRNVFRSGDRSFIIAVRSTDAAAMAQIGKPVLDGVAAPWHYPLS